MNSIISSVREVTENGSVGTWVNLGTQHWSQRITGDRTSLISGKGAVSPTDYPVVLIKIVGGQTNDLSEMFIGQSKATAFGQISNNRSGSPQIFIGLANSLTNGMYDTYGSVTYPNTFPNANNPWDVCHYASYNQIVNFDITVYGLKL